MSEPIPQDYQEILHQIHADVFLERLRDYVAQDGDVPDEVTSDLKDIVRRFLMEDASPSIDNEDIQKLLVDDEIRDQLKQSIRHLIKSQ
ncbi:MAG: hypothetical protein CME33_17735 [Gimesia sp.]|uniref:hypothetical protein n=1 Tax=Gimesia sp. TaxID=2024833 RepID=UPI000C3EA91D|nr:hypothetical protein [Gimesia sp.]MAX38399.1 hypothetical protein [Gimesia sp.]|tara:strand:- start:184 stop:450 length:267 start_codon:yes stop_codon:yes gene_type:complete